LGAVISQDDSNGLLIQDVDYRFLLFMLEEASDEERRISCETTTSNSTESTCDGTPIVYTGGSKPPPYAHKIECRVTLSSLDPFGKVSGGTLQVFARAKELNISTPNPNMKWQILDDGYEGMAISLDYYHQDGVVIAATFVQLVEGLFGVYGLVLIRDKNTFRRAGVFYFDRFRCCRSSKKPT
jgi:hypothetical protein